MLKSPGFKYSLLLAMLMVATTKIAVAQRRYDRYPNATEIRQLRAELHKRIQQTRSGTLDNQYQGFGRDDRSSSEKQARDLLVRAWSRSNPSIAPFLGSWDGYEEDMEIYPSTTKNRVCIIDSGEGRGYFTVGYVNNGIIRTSDRQIIFKEDIFLASGGIEGTQPEINNFFFLQDPRPLKSPQSISIDDTQEKAKMIKDFHQYGCTDSLPVN